MWARLARKYKLGYIFEPLVRWRDLEGGISNSNLDFQGNRAGDLAKREIAFVSPSLNEKEVEDLFVFLNLKKAATDSTIEILNRFQGDLYSKAPSCLSKKKLKNYINKQNALASLNGRIPKAQLRELVFCPSQLTIVSLKILMYLKRQSYYIGERYILKDCFL